MTYQGVESSPNCDSQSAASPRPGMSLDDEDVGSIEVWFRIGFARYNPCLRREICNVPSISRECALYYFLYDLCLCFLLLLDSLVYILFSFLSFSSVGPFLWSRDNRSTAQPSNCILSSDYRYRVSSAGRPDVYIYSHQSTNPHHPLRKGRDRRDGERESM